jgi:hypothetical protein
VSDELLIAISVAVPALFATTAVPLILAYKTDRSRHRDKLEDYARQDAVAAQAAAAAALLAKAQQATTARTDEVARIAAETASSTDRKLDEIHVLVNQKLTDVTANALAASRALLPFLQQAVELQVNAGQQPSRESVQQLADTQNAIVNLEANLQIRAENQAAVEAKE